MTLTTTYPNPPVSLRLSSVFQANLVHHVNRNSMALSHQNSQRLSQVSVNQSNSLSALNSNFDQSIGPLGNSIVAQQSSQNYDGLMPSNLHFQQNNQAFQTLPSLASKSINCCSQPARNAINLMLFLTQKGTHL
jgi:hypothetical protein